MTSSPRVGPEDLLRHEAFVRGLARRLVYDDQATDEVVQDTWVAALAAPRQPLQSLRGWLATIVRRTAGRHARSARRRRVREQFAARDEAAPSVAALAQLRAALDEQSGGDRAAWMAGLLPLAAGPSAMPVPQVAPTAAPTAAALLTGGLLVSTKFKLAAMAAVVVGLVGWALLPPAAQPAGAPSGDASAQAIAARGEPPAGGGEEPAGRVLAREVVTTAAAPAVEAGSSRGAVEVTVLWPDRTPAEGVQVRLSPPSGRGSPAMSDSEGRVTFAELEPGPYYVNVERGSHAVEQPKLAIEAGERETVELQIPDGLDLAGVVVDGHGRGIGGTEIEVTTEAGGWPAVVATTDGEGRFFARDVGVRCQVGARARGRAPSLRRDVAGSVGGSVALRFLLDQPPAVITGAVLDAVGAAVAGARVWLLYEDEFVTMPDGRTGHPRGHEPLDCDAEGRFTAGPLRPGACQLAVTAPGCARWVETIELAAGEARDVLVRLTHAVVVRGVVRDAEGEPVAGAIVTSQLVGSSGGAGSLVRSHARTAADGTYEIDDAMPGPLRLRVGIRSPVTVERRVEAVAGEVVRWDPVLPRIVPLRGRVLDHAGRPVARATVSGEHFDGGVQWCSGATSRDDGRFRIDDCQAGVPLQLTVRTGAFDDVQLAGVVPGDDELLVTLPAPTSCRIRGLVLDDRGEPLPNVDLFAVREGRGALRGANDAATGAFLLAPCPAGGYRVTMLCAGFAHYWSDPHALVDGDVWDLGEVRMQRGGTVRVALVGHDVPH